MKAKKILLIILLLPFFLAACGASKKSVSSSRDLISRGTPNTDGTENDTTTSNVEYYALCNSVQGPNLQGHVTTYLNPVTGDYVWEYIRMELTKVPEQLKQKDSFYIQFFRWQEEVPGKPYVNNGAVGIFYQFQDGSWLNSSPINNISKNTIEKLISDNGIQNTTVDNFLDKVVLILSGMSLEYDAVMINTYDADEGSAALTTTNVLLPAFAADPNIYAQTHPAISLQQLHPNNDIKDNGYNQWQYFQETQALCGQ